LNFRKLYLELGEAIPRISGSHLKNFRKPSQEFQEAIPRISGSHPKKLDKKNGDIFFMSPLIVRRVNKLLTE
jgi:hypothetical protein